MQAKHGVLVGQRQWTAIHQFHSGSAVGDGVTNGMLFTQRLLRNLGYRSEIYVEHLGKGLEKQLHSFKAFADDPDVLLLVHHSFGHDQETWLQDLTCAKALIYHNITPAEFFARDSDFYRYAVLGREQLKRWIEQDLFCAALGVSQLNSTELKTHGFSRPLVTIPLLIDLDLWRRSAQIGHSSVAKKADMFQLLFVGRIARNKNQHLLVKLLTQLVNVNPGVNWQLNLVGGCTDMDYQQQLHELAQQAGIEQNLNLLGKVSHEELVHQYRHADLFVCMSQHEGFGMPLIESMYFDLPVLALDSSNIAATLERSGLLLQDCDSEHELLLRFQALIVLLQQRPELLQQLVESGRERLALLEPELLQQQLESWLADLSA